jgi:hypothetical protein
MTAAAHDFRLSDELVAGIRSRRSRAAIVGVIGLALLAAGFFLVSPNQFYRSYVWSYLFILGLGLGPMAWLMLQYVTGGAWGVMIRRPAEAATRTIPLLLLLFIPIVIGINNLYPWAHANLVAADPVLKQKAPYLNVGFFLIRAAVYFAGWLLFSWLLNRWSLEEDSGSPAAHAKMSKLSAPGLIFWCFSITFMAIDWSMSMQPHWTSSMYGLLFVAGQGLSAIAFLITVMVLLSRYEPIRSIMTPRHLHDLGKFMLALVMVWAYFSFSQFLIIWAGNLPEEIPWYMARLNGGWEYVALALVLGHFALPFALLLSRDLKRNFKLLATIAIFVMFMRLVDLYWYVAPAFSAASFHFSWMDIVAPVGLIGIWVAFFLYQLEKRPLLPSHDPELEEALEHGR